VIATHIKEDFEIVRNFQCEMSGWLRERERERLHRFTGRTTAHKDVCLGVRDFQAGSSCFEERKAKDSQQPNRPGLVRRR
jgi:hypothetical protein